MATYVNDLRLKEIATGDEAGTWGASTNTNLELIAEAFSYGTEASFSSDADATTTIADGSTDPARSLYLKVTSGVSLTATRTLTIAPNTVSKVWIIENATSGSQSINISQGSGANVTIPSGKTKIVYSDGAGSGAAVVDAFASLNLETSGIIETSSSIQTPLIEYTDGDDAMTIADGGQVTFAQNIIGTLGTAAQTNITSVGTLTGLAVNGNTTLTTTDNSNTLTLISTDADAAVGPLLDLYRNSASPADDDFIGKINFRGRNDNSQDVNYGSLAYFIQDASDGTEDAFMQMSLMKGGSSHLLMEATSTETVFNQGSVDQDFRVESNGETHAIFVDAGNDEIGMFTSAPNALLHIGDSNAEGDTTNPALQIGGTSTYRLGMYTSSEGAVIENKNGDDGIQFKVKTAGEAMRIDGGSGNVGIGTSSPTTKLDVVGSGKFQPAIAGGDALVTIAQTNSNAYVHAGLKINAGNTNPFYIYQSGSSNTLRFNYNSLSDAGGQMVITDGGNVGIGTSSPSSYYATELVVDASDEGGISVVNGTTEAGYLAFADGTSGTARYSGYLSYDHNVDALTSRSAGYINFMTGGGVERMRIDSSGNVGIGDTSPIGKLTVKAAGDTIRAESLATDAKNITMSYNDSNDRGQIFCGQDGVVDKDFVLRGATLQFQRSGGTEAMRIDSSGNLNIGTTSEATGSTGGATFSVDSNNRRNLICATTSTSNLELIEFRNPNGTVGTIKTSGSATSYNTSSDARLKDVTGEARGLEVINELNPVSYNWKADGKADEGLIAQEVLDIVPNAVTGSEEKYYQMDYSKLVVHLVKGMKEQQTQIEALQSEINLLKGE